MQKYLALRDIDAYRMALQLSNLVWKLVLGWDYFSKDTVGKQLVRAVDSISANIAEGFGRYTKKDKINFYRYSYGSIKESHDWILKSKLRGLINETEYDQLNAVLQQLPKELHGLIKFTDLKLTI